MDKKYIFLLLGLLLIGSIVTAGVIELSNKQIIIPNKEISISKEITFKADGELTSCITSEPDGNIDEGDIIACAIKMGLNPNTIITEIKDSSNNILKDDGTWIKEKQSVDA